MCFFRTGKLRILYLLALVQLLGGPLVLFQVTMFCKLTLSEAPRVGVATAVIRSWNSTASQTATVAEEATEPGGTKSAPPHKAKLVKPKPPLAPWEPATLILTALSVRYEVAERARTWTPAWPQPPPGPPPRVG